jgi:hypothetical protein
MDVAVADHQDLVTCLGQSSEKVIDFPVEAGMATADGYGNFLRLFLLDFLQEGESRIVRVLDRKDHLKLGIILQAGAAQVGGQVFLEAAHWFENGDRGPRGEKAGKLSLGLQAKTPDGEKTKKPINGPGRDWDQKEA